MAEPAQEELELLPHGTNLPADAQAEQAVLRARRIFQRTLAAWACDVLALRHTGFIRPTWPERGGAAARSHAA